MDTPSISKGIKMKIAIILGTRPEIIKLSPVIRECQKRKIDFFIFFEFIVNQCFLIFPTFEASSKKSFKIIKVRIGRFPFITICINPGIR